MYANWPWVRVILAVLQVFHHYIFFFVPAYRFCGPTVENLKIFYVKYAQFEVWTYQSLLSKSVKRFTNHCHIWNSNLAKKYIKDIFKILVGFNAF